jgi:Secretion system C-terminal sorting domain/Phospholipase/Carboxylesterase
MGSGVEVVYTLNKIDPATLLSINLIVNWLNTKLCMRKLLVLIGILLPLFLFSQQTQNHIAYGGENIGFLQHVPNSYNKANKYPLIIFLHGVGERGNGTSDLYKVAVNSVPRDLAAGNPMRFVVNGKTWEPIILSPQCSSKYGMWPDLYVDGLLQYAKANFNIDITKVYLMGLSMGGGGTIKYASGSFAHANTFAAIATVCAPTVQYATCNVAQANLPYWAFHAVDDKIVSVSAITTIVNSVLRCNPRIKPLTTIYPVGGHSVWTKAFDPNHTYQTPNVFEWMLGYTKGNPSAIPPPVTSPPPAPKNAAPVAVVKSPLNIAYPVSYTRLDGVGSKDNDGYITWLEWTKVSGPASYTIDNTHSINAKLTNLVAGTYVFRLTLRDDGGATSTKDVTVVVTSSGQTKPPPSGTNKAPIAVVQSPVSITYPVNYARLNGVGSRDEDGYVAWFEWSKISGPSGYSINNTHEINARVDNLVAGTYVFRLSLKDNKNALTTKDLTIVVKGKGQTATPPVKTPPSNNPTPGNHAPVAAAAADQLIHLPVNSARLDGTGSKDPDGYISTLNWSKVSGPSAYSIDNPSLANAKVSNLVSGTYTFRLTVKDNRGATSYDDLIIRVNTRPFSNAGANQTIRLPMNSVTLDGSGSADVEGSLRSVTWTKVSGPGTFNIVNPSAAVTQVNNLSAGLYAFRITTVDGDGATTYDEMLITVLKSVTVASASGLEEIAATDSAVALTGSDRYIKPGLNVYPNPAISSVNLSMNIPQTGRAVIRIFDLSGRMMKSEFFSKDVMLMSRNIDISKLGRGLYLLTVTVGDKSIGTQKFLKK